MTVLLYARRKSWEVRSVTIEATREKTPAEDGSGRMVDVIEQAVKVEGDLSAEQLERLTYIVGRCPMHRTLEERPVLKDTVVLVPTKAG